MVVVESKLSDQLWLSFSLALAKPNNIGYGGNVCVYLGDVLQHGRSQVSEISQIIFAGF